MTPQKHRSSWIQEELDFIEKSIADNKPLEEIAKVISLRTTGAILTKINSLGYGYCNKNDGLTYFRNEIKHKERRCKDKSIPTNTEVDTTKKASCIIPKTAVNIACYVGSVAFMLGSMKENKCLHL